MEKVYDQIMDSRISTQNIIKTCILRAIVVGFVLIISFCLFFYKYSIGTNFLIFSTKPLFFILAIFLFFGFYLGVIHTKIIQEVCRHNLKVDKRYSDKLSDKEKEERSELLLELPSIFIFIDCLILDR